MDTIVRVEDALGAFVYVPSRLAEGQSGVRLVVSDEGSSLESMTTKHVLPGLTEDDLRCVRDACNRALHDAYARRRADDTVRTLRRKLSQIRAWIETLPEGSALRTNPLMEQIHDEAHDSTTR